MKLFYRVELHYYVCGFFTDEKGKITECAPIMNWAKNKNLSVFENWVRSKNGKITLLSTENV